MNAVSDQTSSYIEWYIQSCSYSAIVPQVIPGQVLFILFYESKYVHLQQIAAIMRRRPRWCILKQTAQLV